MLAGFTKLYSESPTDTLKLLRIHQRSPLTYTSTQHRQQRPSHFVGTSPHDAKNISRVKWCTVDRPVRVQSPLTKFYKMDKETLYCLVLVTIKWLIQNLLGGSVER